MTFNPDRHHRRSIRLRDYDYTRAGAYFVTVCTRQRDCLFGDVIDDAMVLNEMGHIVGEEWTRSAALRAEIDVDEWVVMPNHVHGIVVIKDQTLVRAYGYTPNHNQRDDAGAYVHGAYVHGAYVHGAYVHTPLRSPSRTLGAMVRGFKAAATTRINIMRDAAGVSVWQRNYYEHIIRSDDELHRIREYIADNPRRWSSDIDNPQRVVGAAPIPWEHRP